MKLNIFLLICVVLVATSYAGNVVKRGIFNLAPIAPVAPIYPTFYHHAPLSAVVPAVIPPPVSYASVTKYAYPSYPIYKSYYAPAPLVTKVIYPHHHEPYHHHIHAEPIIRYKYFH